MTDFIIGRQQIVDQKLNIFAYELLFRGHDFDLNNKDDGALATNQIITDCILEIGLNKIVGPHLAFFNFTTQNILDKTALKLPKDRIAIEVLESTKIDLSIINNLKELSELGYTIALDDFVISDEWIPLLKLADIIKLDVLEMGETKTRELIKQLKPYNVKLLAEKVETYDEFQYLHKLGCAYFQGYFFSKPNPVAGHRIGINQTAAIKLLTAINKSGIELEELSNIISKDISLTYKLLHYLNSAFFALPNKISSLPQAITYLGLNEIRRWTNILALSSLTNKPAIVLQNALIRGRMCELLATLMGEDAEHFFLTGILSSLDSFLDFPLEEALSQLPLSSDIVSAILNKEGLAGEALQCVMSYEHWNVSAIAFRELSQKLIGNAYIESIKWATDVLSTIQ
jgi:EAL and modified HD-GYP domain-containing signal transduction protein